MKINPLLLMCPLSNRERDVGDKRPKDSVQRIDSIMKSVSLIEIEHFKEVHSVLGLRLGVYFSPSC